MKLELLTSPSYTKLLVFGDKARESFPRPLPFPSWPSRPCIKVPNVACEAEDINAIHLNFKTIFRNV